MHGIAKTCALAAVAAFLGWTARGGQAPEAVQARADGWLKPFVAAGDFSGVVLIAREDRVLFEQAYGYSDVQSPNRSDTRFRTSSISQTFTAAAIGKLVSDGKLGYADTLARYVPGIPSGDAITIEQLLLHASGVGVLDSEDARRDCLSHAEALRRLRAAKPLFAPGQRSQQSNEGYFLLAAVIERVSGVSYEQFLRANVFEPLQMRSSGTACRELPGAQSAYGNVATGSEARLRPVSSNEAVLDGAGSVYSTVEDLHRWLRAVDTGAVLPSAQLKYPYGWGRRKYGTRELLEQSGQVGGFFSHVAIYPGEHLYAVVLSNVQSGFSGRVAKDLERVLFGGTVSKPPAVTAMTLGERSMNQYAGDYRSNEAGYTQTLAIRDGRLAMHWGGDPFWRELVMVDGDTFFLRADYAT